MSKGSLGVIRLNVEHSLAVFFEHIFLFRREILCQGFKQFKGSGFFFQYIVIISAGFKFADITVP